MSHCVRAFGKYSAIMPAAAKQMPVRCSTPSKRNARPCSSSDAIKCSATPSSTMRAARSSTALRNGASSTLAARLRPSARFSETPMINMKNGKMKSASVQPFQSACSIHGKTWPQSPASFTTSMAATVKPRSASTELIRFEECIKCRSQSKWRRRAHSGAGDEALKPQADVQPVQYHDHGHHADRVGRRPDRTGQSLFQQRRQRQVQILHQRVDDVRNDVSEQRIRRGRTKEASPRLHAL